MTNQTNTLEFNGQKMAYIFTEKQFWIAIKPICDALNVNYNRQAQNIRADEILGLLVAKQQLVAADNKRREMLCLPERYVYGWLFSIRSDSKALHEYKLLCYDILYDYFKGSFTQRQQMLRQKSSEAEEMAQLKEKLSEHADFNRFLELDANQAKYRKQLRQLDQDLMSGQMNLFHKLLNQK